MCWDFCHFQQPCCHINKRWRLHSIGSKSPSFHWQVIRRRLSLMLLVANLPHQNDTKKLKNDWNPDTWVPGTHLRGLSESFPMHTNMTGFGWFSKILGYFASDKSNLSIGRVELGSLAIKSWHSLLCSPSSVRARNSVFFFFMEPNCIFKSYLKVLCIETSKTFGSLHNFEGAPGEFKGANFEPWVWCT